MLHTPSYIVPSVPYVPFANTVSFCTASVEAVTFTSLNAIVCAGLDLENAKCAIPASVVAPPSLTAL